MDYAALIVAAGSGSRVGLGYNKMLYKLQDGETLLAKTVHVFTQDDRCKQIIIVASEHDIEAYRGLVDDQRITFAIGGNTRQVSVYKGLCKVKEDYVLIHDGARPWLSLASIDRLLETLTTHPACLLCVPVKDTIKEVKNGIVIKTLVRSDLRQAQTPQAFASDLIKECHEKAKDSFLEATDDAQIVEYFSEIDVVEVVGDYQNIKVTTQEDLINR